MPYVPFSTTDYTPSTTPPVLFGTDLVVLADITALKAVPTVSLDLGTVRNVTSATAGEVRQAWQLIEGAGADVDDVPGGVALPDDYDDPANVKVWSRTL